MKPTFGVLETQENEKFVRRDIALGTILPLPFIIKINHSLPDNDPRYNLLENSYIQDLNNQGISLTDSLVKAKMFCTQSFAPRNIKKAIDDLCVVMSNLGCEECELEILFLLATVKTRLATVIGNSKKKFTDNKHTWPVLKKELVIVNSLPGLIKKIMSDKNRPKHVQISFEDTPYFLDIVKRAHIVVVYVRTGFNLNKGCQTLHAVWHQDHSSQEIISHILKETIFSKIQPQTS